MNFKAIFDGEALTEAVPDVTVAQTKPSEATLALVPQHDNESMKNDATRNRNSIIYAEASEQMLGMGNRELHSKRHFS